MRVWLISAILAISSIARANSPRDEGELGMREYFAGEISGGWVLMAMGAAELTAGGILIADGSDRARGASYASFGFGAAHLVAGVYVTIASRVRRRLYDVAIDEAPDVWLVAERQRMKGVSKQLLILKVVEVTLIAGGGTMIAIGRSQDRPQLEGAGYALAIGAGATLLFDIFAARRASRYRDRLGESSLDAWGMRITTDAANQPVLLVGPSLHF